MLTTASLIPLAAGLGTITEILIKVYIAIVIAGVVFNIWSWFKSREIKAPFLFLTIFVIGGIIVALAVVLTPLDRCTRRALRFSQTLLLT